MPKASSITQPFQPKSKIANNWKLIESIDFTDKLPQVITYDYPEFSAVCPFSGLPDIARVKITVIPGERIFELKSLKLYFLTFRNVGIYQEEMTDKVYKDINRAIAPKYLRVESIYNTRGGLDTVALVESGDPEEALRRE